MRLAGKAALITGSSSGIGEGIAVRFAREGANVVINYRSSEQEAKETKDRVEAVGGTGLIVQGDVSVLEDTKNLIARGVEHFGKLDILVNNAGLERATDFLEVNEDEYDLVMDVNLKGAFFTAQAFVKHLFETQRPGRIINISSVHEELPFPQFTPYCMSKGGMKMMARNLAIELGPYGITVNNVAPGAIATPINSELLENEKKRQAVVKNIPLGRLGEPEDVAGLVAFLASDDAKYITGSTFYVDGGLLWNYQEQ